MTLPLSSPATTTQGHDVGTDARSCGEDEGRGSSRAPLLSGTPSVSRRVQDLHGVPHVLLVLRQGKRPKYRARQRGMHKRKRNVQEGFQAFLTDNIICPIKHITLFGRYACNPKRRVFTTGGTMCTDFAPIGVKRVVPPPLQASEEKPFISLSYRKCM